MRSVAFLSQKGGSGKTTLAVHVAVAAGEAKEQVVLIDTDPQASAADWGNARKRAGIEGFPTVERASAATLAHTIARARQERTTLAIIDMAPHATAGVDIIAASADFLLIPYCASAFDLRAITTSVNVARAAGKPAAFILNACDPRVPEVAEARNVLVRHGLQVAPIDIGQRVLFSRAVASGQSVTEFDPQGESRERDRRPVALAQATAKEPLMPPKSKDTGLAAFTDSPQEEEKPSPIRTKGKGKYVHNQLRMTHDQWELSHQFARSEGISLNRLALLGISKLREEKGLPGLPDL